jgi:hypothetical protein
MQRFLRLAVLIPTLTFLPVVAAQNAKTDKNAKPAFDETKVRSSLVNNKDGVIQGKLTMYDLEKKEFTVQYVHQIKTPNKEGQKKLAAIIAQGRQAKDKATVERLRPQYEAALMEAFDVEEHPIIFECVGDKNMTFRTKVAPLDPDTGKVKKLTAAEEKKLKGDDPKEPGYILDPKDLDNDMMVQVYIDKAKLKALTPAKTDDKKDAKKDEKKDADKGAKDEGEKIIYPIFRIVVLPPPAEGSGAFNPFKK